MRKAKQPPKPFLVKRQDPEPTAESIEEAFQLIANEEIAEFADSINDARKVWRKYRALVEAPELPPFLLQHFIEMWDCEPNDELDEPNIDVLGCIKANAITPKVRKKLLPEARDIAAAWIRNRAAG
jgi:hypothetical protein